ncbi:MAG: helix-turn-helix domain-containing protein [Gemmatimonadaceae bacterium]|nr:helix-turn-helix domain-containing protein [Gemmatimonadaceae bacterium]
MTSPEAPYRYTEWAPSPALAPWVLSFWQFEAADTLTAATPYTVWPDGCASIVLLRITDQRGPILFVGPRHTAMSPPVLPGQRLIGIRLWSDAIGAVLGMKAAVLRDWVGPASASVAEEFASLDAALDVRVSRDVERSVIDHWLVARLHAAVQPAGPVRGAIRAIAAAGGEGALRAIIPTGGLGARQLQRRFRAETGLTMQEDARVRRLRSALALQLQQRLTGWSRIAAETGFVDHAHLTREFVAPTGLRPRHAATHLAGTQHSAVTP